MGRLNHLWSASPSTIAWAVHELDLLQEPLSEIEILRLQDIFLTNGLHSIKVRSIKSGRSIMYQFLDLLNVYCNEAAVTLSPDPLRIKTVDVSLELIHGGYLDLFHESFLEDFFIDHFYYDFMWIELTNDLLYAPWFESFRNKIIDLNLQKTIPIIIIAYEKA